MKRLVFFAVVMAVATPAAVQLIDRSSSADAGTDALMTVEVKPEASSRSSRKVEVRADAYGHFAVRTYVNGQPVEMLADTGATAIALRESDARRAGLHVNPADFTTTVRTANGEIRAARVQIAMVEVESIRMHNVDALVLPDKSLGENLLGMSFIGRLDSFEVGSGRLVLSE
ncbi:TIGR02281 family clan AA aspartic protease [Methylobrevis albus]|uniref:TIGR02281 family clan AA aspartic protease n=1 Tax=Methylobrevis albus TaxID=2793297 RepID=A0A931I3Y8_9HYPH|nr:TIGR02281 family clan AA aspartic protease [Methylobrevis albus]MBH0238461.1 TIGR02281 family clan AA aspartic protease [Methylobrevis albus]